MNPQLRDNLASAIREAAIDVDLDQLLDVIDTVLAAHAARAAAARGISIGELNLSVRAGHSLRREGIVTLGQLTAYTAGMLLELRDIGPGAVAEIRAALAQHGLRLTGDRPAPP